MGARARPTAATCCARRRTASPSAWSCSSTLGAGARRRAGAPARGRLARGAARRRARARRRAASPSPRRWHDARDGDRPGLAVGRAARRGRGSTELDREREVAAAVAVVNRVAALPPHRLGRPLRARGLARAGARDPGRLGRGRAGRRRAWLHARELPWRGRGAARGARGGDRAAALRPQERLAALLGARSAALLCEELALRARLDLDQGRLAPRRDRARARARGGASASCAAEGRQDLALRIAELEQLRARRRRAGAGRARASRRERRATREPPASSTRRSLAPRARAPGSGAARAHRAARASRLS